MIRQGSIAVVATMLLVSVPALGADGIMVRGPIPTAEQANDAFSRNPEYQADIGNIKAVLACVPAVWEDTTTMPQERDWWCLAETQLANNDRKLAEFALMFDPGAKRFETLEGEYMGMCPLARDVQSTLLPMVTMSGVTGLEKGQLSPGNFAIDMSFDQQLPSALLEGPPYLFYCDYIGRRGKANYLLKTFVTYDAGGYHFTPHSFEQLFNDDGQLVDQNGKVLDDQS
ncbi:hypothetical protein [Devosia sp. 63-57]|uniref:hypothetical protein n=1 Tax=Devosia sp. 63-57 TaxID=1895751 RepID=UPI0008686E75|nr:hypothetical protein [Devosia sp. 63-57]ODT50599.1 MAG: hypothetical protein ABS74_03565 [Pelagibacterium sp. SCN 63-126]ODU83477.1 MAG: hypothetical protein ABT14_15810 [Pelagibacterium sp. SCN 63-17]OJX45452.1 MAG: hypothetical protein BGO80_06485 [Devosia sp. 63-57]